jgi:hypothetical protein
MNMNLWIIVTIAVLAILFAIVFVAKQIRG